MLKIAICDDEKVFRDNINKYVAAYLNEKEISFDKTDWQEGQPAIVTLQVGKGNQKETEEYSQYDDSGYDYGYSDEYYGQEGDYTYDQNEYTEQTNDY